MNVYEMHEIDDVYCRMYCLLCWKLYNVKLRELVMNAYEMHEINDVNFRMYCLL